MNIKQFYILFTIVNIINFQSGCKSDSKKVSNAESKFDAQLRNKISKIKQANVDSSLQCFVKIFGNFDESKERKLRESGVIVLSVLNEIATIEGQPDAILKVASFDFVHSISLGQIRNSPD